MFIISVLVLFSGVHYQCPCVLVVHINAILFLCCSLVFIISVLMCVVLWCSLLVFLCVLFSGVHYQCPCVLVVQ